MMVSRLIPGKAVSRRRTTRYQNAPVWAKTVGRSIVTPIYTSPISTSAASLRTTVTTTHLCTRLIQYLLTPKKDDEQTIMSLGAEWDDDKKKWYVPDSVSLMKFSHWIPPEDREMRERVLDVPFEDKDLVKYLGAKWNTTKKQWFLPSDVSSHHFQSWLPSTTGANDIDNDVHPNKDLFGNIDIDANEEYLHTAPKVFLDVNTCDNDAIKKLGAEWDESEKKYYIPDHLDIKLFRKHFKFYLEAGRSDSDALKLLGGEYDFVAKRWCIPKYIPRRTFSPWLFSYYNEFLDVPFESREEAKALGALWEPDYRMWYYPEVYHAINKNTGENEAHKKAREDFRQWFRFPLHVVYEEKDIAKDLGAKWDSMKKLWYAPIHVLGPDSKLRENLLYREQITDIIEHHEQ